MRAAEPAEGTLVGVVDAQLRRRAGERLALEVRVTARAGQAADVEQLAHAGALEQLDELLQRAPGVSDRVNNSHVRIPIHMPLLPHH